MKGFNLVDFASMPIYNLKYVLFSVTIELGELFNRFKSI